MISRLGIEDRLGGARDVGRGDPRQRGRHPAVGQHGQAVGFIADQRVGDRHPRAQRGGARADQAAGGAADLVRRDRRPTATRASAARTAATAASRRAGGQVTVTAR